MHQLIVCTLALAYSAHEDTIDAPYTGTYESRALSLRSHPVLSAIVARGQGGDSISLLTQAIIHSFEQVAGGKTTLRRQTVSWDFRQVYMHVV